jgi:hypothetical protein
VIAGQNTMRFLSASGTHVGVPSVCRVGLPYGMGHNLPWGKRDIFAVSNDRHMWKMWGHTGCTVAAWNAHRPLHNGLKLCMQFLGSIGFWPDMDGLRYMSGVKCKLLQE